MSNLRLSRAALGASLAIALAAGALRASLAGFPVGWHHDEEIVARLVERNLRGQDGRGLSVNWANVEGRWWTRATYQFSPYTWLQTAVAGAVLRATGEAPEPARLVRIARSVSVVSGALAGLALFLFARELSGSAGVGLLAQALAGLSPLAVQDGLYARVDALVGLLTNLALWLGLLALRAPPGRRSLRLAALAGVAGLTLAAKWNALVAAAAWVAALLLDPGEGPARRRRHAASGTALFAAAFLLATPEALRDLRPLVDGFAWELGHYAEGHPPHQAFDASDGNLRYWASYFFWIGLGPLGFGAALLGAVRGVPGREAGLYFRGLLAFATIACSLPRARFERNWEVALGLLCASAALGCGWLAEQVRAAGPARAPALAAVALALLAQPALTTRRFAELLDPATTALFRLQRDPRNGGAQMPFATAAADPATRWDGSSPLALFDYGDPFSRAGLARWRARAAGCEISVYESDWAGYRYPFSTIDMYHGPRRAFVLRPCPAARP